MSVDFFGGVSGPVELEGRVFDRDLVVFGQALLQSFEDARGMPVIEAFVGEHHMSGEHRQVRVDASDVEVVDFLHVFDRFEVLADLVQVELTKPLV